MLLSDRTVSLDECAAALGMRPAQLMRSHRRLTRERGFPAKLPTGWAWPRKLVELWIDNHAALPSPGPGEGGPALCAGSDEGRPANENAPALVFAQRQALEARYAGGRP